LTTKPLIARWRLRRTNYVLTSRRAFTLEPHRIDRRVRFVFIDALPAGFTRTLQPDGIGDVGVGLGMTFEQIADAATAHARLVDAVLTARRNPPDLGWQESPHAL
jgi:hypothetical protein